jgi:DNA-directed RNA polymerase subunit M/transcription elongation factor TFIIS
MAGGNVKRIPRECPSCGAEIPEYQRKWMETHGGILKCEECRYEMKVRNVDHNHPWTRNVDLPYFRRKVA